MATTEITAAVLKALREKLDTLAGRIEHEYNTGIPAQRTSAASDADLLAQLDRRAGDIKVTAKMHTDAKTVFKAAVAAFMVDPKALAIEYAKVLTLTAQIEAVLDFRGTPGRKDDETKVDPTGTNSDKGKKDDKSGKPEKDKDNTGGDNEVKDPKTDGDENQGDDKSGKSKGKKDDKSDDPKTDPVLAAIQGLTASCDKNHQDAMGAITALRGEVTPGLITPELAAIINKLTPDQLKAVVSRRGLSPQEAAIVEALTAFYGSPEELRRDLEALRLAATGNMLDRFRFTWSGGDGSNRSGSHR